jgi:hypothetical protein
MGFLTYDHVNNITYQLAGCTAAYLATNPVSPAVHGTTISLSGSQSTCPGTPTYRFWIRAPGGSWSMVQDYSTNGYSWTTSGLAAGTYGLEVDVRDQGVNASYEATTWINFVLT